jgi:hypothetical protein
MNAANVDLGNLMLRLNAQAMEIIRLRQENDDIRNGAHEDESIPTDDCRGCNRTLIGFDVVVDCPAYTNDSGTECTNACQDCVVQYNLETERIKTDYCEACSTSFVKGDYANSRPVVWFKEPVAIPGSSRCSSACASCVSKHGLEGRALAW